MWVIEKIEISGGFLPGLSVLIPKGLTCIIGARGKSTLVEAVRFAFCGISAAPKMCADLIHANLAGGALVPSRPGELHPEPLTDPDVNLSIHPARATQRRLPPSIKTRSSSGYPLTPS